jgi:hypothetical protein
MEISIQSIDAMKKAKTPEDAYKIFADAASGVLNQVIADILANALSKASVAVSAPSTVGWENLVRGLLLQVDWATPMLIEPPSSMTIFSSSGRITIGGNWSF